MSVSSATTLISPSATTTSNKAHPPARRGSHVAHGGHHAAHHSHGPKRRPSTHASHSHNHASSSRRPSDGEHGRRAMTAGLTMHGLDGAHPKPKKRGSGDRPGAKTSRSDTHLPRLSRTTSITSSVSQTSSHSRGKSKGKERKQSTGSVQVLSEDGHDTGEVIETSEDGWESGDAEEEDQEEKKSRGQKKEKRSDQKLADMRRTVSDTQAELPTKSTSTPAIDTGGELVESPSGLEPNHQPPSKQKTTGFAGTIQTPAPDAEMEAQALHNINTPGWNDPTHVMPAHQIRHQKSARSMTTMSAVEPVSRPSSLKPSSGTEGERTPRPGSMMRTGSGKIMQREQVPPATDNDVQVRPNGPTQTRSTGGSGMPKEGIDESPSFPFPKLPSQKASPNIQQPTPPSSTESAVKGATQPSELPRQRKASGTEGAPHRLRHRPSNSSLRSIQSLRAPPHPLNSPTGYRSGLPTYATSRAGSQFNSPQKSERRGPSMHQPPVAPPVVYRETASGQGWDAQRSTDGDPRATGKSRTSQDQRAPASVSMTQDNRTRQTADRTSSFSSTRSLQGIMSSTGIGRRVNTGTISPPASVDTPQSRPKAADLAAAAVKMPTTNDPVVYHHSLGYPAASAETAHLISRFLPPKRTKRPEWEITDENASTHSGIGLPKGAYRDAHESLIRMMRDMGNPAPQMARRATNRTVSQHSLLSSGPNGRSNLGLQDAASASNGALTPGVGVGVTRGRNGPLVVARGEGWRGKTPFELSVERCVAQRPTRAMGLGV